MKNSFLCFFLVFSFVFSGLSQNELPQIQIISTWFDQSVEFLHIAYSIEDADNSEFTVDALLSEDDGERFDFMIGSTSGDIGPGIINDGPKELILGCSGIDPNHTVARLIVSDNDTLNIQSIVDQVDMARLELNLMAVQGIRHRTGNPGHLDSVRTLIISRLNSHGLMPVVYPFMHGGFEAKNIIGMRQGIAAPNSEYYVGGHYDTVVNSPGADDNGTAIAAMLEAAHVLSPLTFNKTIRYVAWDLEEFGLVGSMDYVNNVLENESDIQGYLNMEMLGYYTEAPNSQQLPGGFNILFPVAYQEIQDNQFKGDFLVNVGNTANSQAIMEDFETIADTYVPELSVISVESPGTGAAVPDLLRSDHASFWLKSIPSVMLTDAANFRNPNYHTANDVIDSLDMNFLTNNTKAVVAFLASKSDYNHASYEDISSIPVMSGVFNLNSNQNINVYPIPTNDELIINLSDSEYAKIDEIIIYSNAGRPVKSVRQHRLNNIEKSISTVELSEGMYFIKVMFGREIRTGKFLVLR